LTYDKLMTSLGETYEKLMKFMRFFVNRAPGISGGIASDSTISAQ